MPNDLPITHPGQDDEPGDEHILAALEEMDQPSVGLVGVGDQSKMPDSPALVEMDTAQTALGAPGPAVIDPTQPGSAPPERGMRSAAVSTRGMTDAGIAKSGGVFGKWQADAAGKNQLDASQMEADQATMAQDMQRKREALAQSAVVESRHMEKLADIRKQELAFQQMQHDAEELAQVQSKKEAAGYIAAYKEDMVAVRALMAQSGNPLGGLSKTQGFAIAGAAAAQGYLAARYGIKVDAVSQIDRWVEREIEQHQTAIKNQTSLAESNLTLYGLARQGAQDDWEARHRLRGLVIDGFKAQIQVEAGKYGSEAAMADANMKLADLSAVETANNMALRDKVEKRAMERYQQAIDGAKAQAAASVQWAQVKLDRDKFGYLQTKDEQERKAKAEKETFTGVVSDPFDVQRDKDGKAITGGKNKWRLDTSAPAGIQSDTAKTVREGKESFTNLRQGTDELQRLYSEAHKEMNGPNSWRWRVGGEAYQAWAVERDRVVGTIRRAMTGLAGSKEEDARWERQLSDDNLLQTGDTRALINSFSQYARRSYNAKMSSMVGVGLIAAEDGSYSAPDPQADPAGASTDRQMLSKEPPVKTAVTNNVTAVGDISAPATSRSWAGRQAKMVAAAQGGAEAEPAPWTFIFDPKAEPQAEYTLADKLITDMAKGVFDPAGYRALAKFDKNASPLPDDDAILRSQLVDGLRTVAEGGSGDGYAKKYAEWLLIELNADPQGLAKDLGIGQD